jgi:hypothetical protein
MAADLGSEPRSVSRWTVEDVRHTHHRPAMLGWLVGRIVELGRQSSSCHSRQDPLLHGRLLDVWVSFGTILVVGSDVARL